MFFFFYFLWHKFGLKGYNNIVWGLQSWFVYGGLGTLKELIICMGNGKNEVEFFFSEILWRTLKTTIFN